MPGYLTRPLITVLVSTAVKGLKPAAPLIGAAGWSLRIEAVYRLARGGRTKPSQGVNLCSQD